MVRHFKIDEFFNNTQWLITGTSYVDFLERISVHFMLVSLITSSSDRLSVCVIYSIWKSFTTLALKLKI